MMQSRGWLRAGTEYVIAAIAENRPIRAKTVESGTRVARHAGGHAWASHEEFKLFCYWLCTEVEPLASTAFLDQAAQQDGASV